MTVKSRFSRPRLRMTRFSSGPSPWFLWLDVSMMLIWGTLFLKYWLSGEILFLLHPNYVWLTIAAAFVLLGMAVFKVSQQLAQPASKFSSRRSQSVQHLSLLPKGWSNAILILVGLLGWFYAPQPFTSDIALQRGVTDTLMVTRLQPQSFRVSVNPEDKSITDWVRTLNVYPEPDAYQGDPVDVSGFIIHPPDLPDNYVMIARFILTCCAADAYPVALPVRLQGDRSDYAADGWFRVQGEMTTETLNGDRRLTIAATRLESIPQPRNPYDY
ncbi:MAG: TIGR03943 family protein [Cyanothece sp. SIO2G6]|nr:TIGR03943 family protein [Cyanothece sp. SIO2G6]